MDNKEAKKLIENHGVKTIKYFNKTSRKWEEGMLWQLLNPDRNLWKVYIPRVHNKGGYFLAMEIKEGNPKEDYCGYLT